jgi:hypothetical protein
MVLMSTMHFNLERSPLQDGQYVAHYYTYRDYDSMDCPSQDHTVQGSKVNFGVISFFTFIDIFLGVRQRVQYCI